MHYSMRASVIYANIALSGPDSGVVLSEKMGKIYSWNLEIFVAGWYLSLLSILLFNNLYTGCIIILLPFAFKFRIDVNTYGEL